MVARMRRYPAAFPPPDVDAGPVDDDSEAAAGSLEWAEVAARGRRTASPGRLQPVKSVLSWLFTLLLLCLIGLVVGALLGGVISA